MIYFDFNRETISTLTLTISTCIAYGVKPFCCHKEEVPFLGSSNYEKYVSKLESCERRKLNIETENWVVSAKKVHDKRSVDLIEQFFFDS